MWSLAKKMFSRKKTNESVPACNHDESDKPPSTTRVVLIMCSVALLIFSVGYTLKPVSTIVREVSEPDIIHDHCNKNSSDKDNKDVKNNTDNTDKDN